MTDDQISLTDYSSNSLRKDRPMDKAVDRLTDRVALSGGSVWIPPHVRVVKGKPQKVKGYFRKMRGGQRTTIMDSRKDSHGNLYEVKTEYGPEIRAGSIKSMKAPNGVEIKRGTAYQSESNGKVYTGRFAGYTNGDGLPVFKDVSVYDPETKDRKEVNERAFPGEAIKGIESLKDAHDRIHKPEMDRRAALKDETKPTPGKAPTKPQSVSEIKTSAIKPGAKGAFWFQYKDADHKGNRVAVANFATREEAEKARKAMMSLSSVDRLKAIVGDNPADGDEVSLGRVWVPPHVRINPKTRKKENVDGYWRKGKMGSGVSKRSLKKADKASSKDAPSKREKKAVSKVAKEVKRANVDLDKTHKADGVGAIRQRNAPSSANPAGEVPGRSPKVNTKALPYKAKGDPNTPLSDEEYKAEAARVAERMGRSFELNKMFSTEPGKEGEFGKLPASERMKIANEMAANGEPVSTDARFQIDAAEGAWTKERERVHREVITTFMQRANDIPTDRKAAFTGGLGGSGKGTALKAAKNGELDIPFDPEEYFIVDPDAIKEFLAERGYIPETPGMTPMESSGLVHEESSYLAKEISGRLQDQGTNMIWDITMASEGSVQKRIDTLKENGYDDVKAIFVDVTIDQSVNQALARHRGGLDKHRAWAASDDKTAKREFGGRFVPPALIKTHVTDSENNSKNRDHFEKLKDQFEDWAVVDNTSLGKKNGGSKIAARKGDARDTNQALEKARAPENEMAKFSKADDGAVLRLKALVRTTSGGSK